MIRQMLARMLHLQNAGWYYANTKPGLFFGWSEWKKLEYSEIYQKRTIAKMMRYGIKVKFFWTTPPAKPQIRPLEL